MCKSSVLERVARDILGWLAVLLEQLCGPLGGWYLLDPIGEIPLVIDEFEDGILLSYPRFWVSQDREAIAVLTNNQVLREAVI